MEMSSGRSRREDRKGSGGDSGGRGGGGGRGVSERNGSGGGGRSRYRYVHVCRNSAEKCDRDGAIDLNRAVVAQLPSGVCCV